jgi:chromosome segregation ATPase
VLLSQESVRSELMNAEIQAARNRYERDPSFRIIPVRLDDTTAVLTDSYLTRFNSLTAKGGDVQDVAAQIRKTLDISSSDDNERDRSVRLNAELNAALEERLRLNAELSATHAQLEATRARSDTEIGAALEEKARLKAGLDAALKENRRVNRTARILLIALLALAVLLSSVVTLTFAFRNELNTAAQQLKTVTQQLNTVTQQLKTVTQQLNESVAGPKLGMTKEQVEKALGPALAQDRDPDGHLVLTYKHPTLGSMYVIIDSSSGKVVRVQSDPPR